MEKEFVAAQERLRPQEDKAEEDRSKEASVLPPRNREMGVFELKINQLVLDCAYCQQPLRPDQIRPQAYTCAGGHIYCGACTRRHEKACISKCHLLDRTIAQMEFKCILCDSGGEYVPYGKFFEHRCNTDVVDPKLPERQMEFAFYGRGRIKTSLLVCSECELPLRPPIFRHISGDVLICSPCYRGDIVNYVRCSELDHLVQGIMVKCVACQEYIPFSALAWHQLRECPSKHKLQKIAPGSSARKNLCDEEETERLSTCSSCIQGKNKQKAPYEVGKMDKHIVRGDEVGNDDDSLDDNHEMGVFELKINQLVLDCAYCQQPLRPDQIRAQAYTCAGSHIYCGACTRRHEKACISRCHLLDRTIAQMEFKCILCDSGGEYVPYGKFFEHRCNTDVVDPKLPERQMEFAFYGRGRIKTSLLVCSECELPLRPPIFRHISGDVLICSPCYRGDIVNYVRCSELDHLVQGIMVKCVACQEYIPFSALAWHQLRECPSKHKLQKIAPGSSARKNLCDEEETERLSTCSSCIQGKNKQKAPYEVGKMDKHIVRGDEVGNDDDSLDDNHAESGMRVAENAQKTAPTAAHASTSTCRCLPITAPLKPPLPHRPVTRLFQAAHNRNRGQQRTKREGPNIQRGIKRRSCEQS
ncbi:hypothetical protein PAHAL_3G034500 [Panicum hallii]|uniref:Uncharacterized protein n=1 Tax=Panicum hallii TaxID=206008 RepID=A0A2T8KGY0_9POAL|nr:hypothetical protein PAHAL_3G034500 [Panicum hallii]